VEEVACEGAPRELGLDQGHACRDAIRDAVARSGARVPRWRLPSLRPLVSGPVLGRGPGRETIRHYAHLAERTMGLALGSDLPFEPLMELLVQAAPPLGAGAAAVSLAGEGGAAPLLARALPPATSSGSRWVRRRSRPHVGFASEEVTLPWLAASAAGVNEAGLAAAAVPEPGAQDGCTAAVLLVQECLQRFSELAPALDWCLQRPAWGAGHVLLAHADGEVAAVALADGRRRTRREREGLLVAGLAPEREAELRKRVAEGGRAALAEALDAEGAWVAVDPAAGSLALAVPAGERDGARNVEAPSQPK
jgi:hypothetical protein